ncbi:hypothetical protein G6F46_006001 [Rhizopus delemar]|uniref:Uncharacterized protein n=2 Tax=Rhizopus TaxID=4842 RepID=A0A9P6YWQ7_9FUNG|nr:hypothetical protein G6F55_005133 [Rhizopus delemar]KAG1537000.1 hypothetical protein G6F51_010634 [Rhizopus arrhizus]KAG1496864.1 hypothetical protein G6F54_006177 [Rhizopus delemar]KAG1505757.1 hypothetical protein G6F53_010120 [Rhizopus delemar]KAG1521994.1 hypothetical protein G6F52_006243 [Rhizopus delemar]
MPPLHQKKRSPTPEFFWARQNDGKIDHIEFFNYFIHYSRKNVISRYSNILNIYLSDDNRRKLLAQKYKTWKSSKESKIFWQERELKRQQLTQDFRSSSEISTTADNIANFNISFINSTFTNKSLYVMDTSKAIELIESNIASSANNQGEYIINDVDILKQFNIFQQHILGMLETTSLKYTNHLDHALATASVLMVRNSLHTDMEKFFHKNTIRAIMNDRLSNCGMFTHNFAADLLMDVKVIIQDVIAQKITSIRAAKLLLALVKEDTNEENDLYQNKVILCFKRMIEEFPRETLCVEETELITRFIQSSLQPLFDDIDSEVYLRWTNTQTEEHREDTVSCSDRRPDGCLTAVIKNKKINLGFSEVKTTKYAKDSHKLNADLYRLGVFSKNTINANHLAGALSIQITGTSIAFFLTEKKREGLYLMTELDVIKFPTTLKEIPQLLGYVDNLCDILHVFHTKCWPHPGRF